MTHLFDMVNQLFAGAVPVADFLWDFPTNFDWYANIPILGNFSVAILLLLGGSLFFTIRFGFVQVKEFKTSIKMLTHSCFQALTFPYTGPLSLFKTKKGSLLPLMPHKIILHV